MLPSGTYSNINTESEEMTSHTYKLDLTSKRIYGYVDAQAAMLQSIEKILNTERFTYEIYTGNYGAELESLIGKDFDFVQASLEKRLSEALLEDDRVLQLQNFEVQKVDSESLEVSCVVTTIHGDIFIRKEMKLL